MASYRFHRAQRWDQKFAVAPESIKQTISNALAMLGEGVEFPSAPADPHDPPEPIIRRSEMKDWGRPGELMVALGDVLIRYYIAIDYHVIVLDDLIWFD